MNKKTNIVLIGMPGVGKSTIGVLLAKELNKRFMDTDVYIQAKQQQRLQEIIDTLGLEKFREIEEKNVTAIDTQNTVIATGGSVVYSQKAMDSLKKTGLVIHLALPMEQVKKRITDISTRGLVMEPGQNLDSLYEKRMPLYRKYADITVNCMGLDHKKTLDAVLKVLK
jgi:shikimate kinase